MLNLLITPDFPPEFFANWHMFNTQLQRALDTVIRLQTPTGYREQQDLLDSETVALVYANPFDAGSLMRDKGYIPLAKPDLPSDQVLVVVNAQSAFAALGDLPADSRVLITANRDMESIGLGVLQGTAITADTVQWLHARTFTELARRLMANEAEIGLFLASSFRGLNTGTQGSLKILFETEFEDFGHVMLLHPDFADQADKLRAALLNMAQSPVSRMTLADLGMAKGFVAAGGAGDGKRDDGEVQDGQAEAETVVEHQTADMAQAASTAEAEQTTAAEGQPENG
ncbi:PhnD/SsuA/transferrin family substrate-binding protein [Kingella oralis]|uniref:PhnD/SsuA/transferrin family substrate-binding protein n=1 Tax=Kingella oralis TaxID=505 RepID=UPI0034E56582